MKKVIALMLFLFVFILVGCESKATVDNLSLYNDFLETKELYEKSPSGKIKLTVDNGEELSIIEFAYNNNGSRIQSMKLVSTEGTNVTEAYVKDGKAYINMNGDKTFASLDSEAGSDLVSDYWFISLTTTTFKTLNKSIFNASEIVSINNGEANLVWNPESYILINEDFTDEEFLEADARFYRVKEVIKAITMKISFEKGLIKSVDSKWTNNDDKESTIKIEFLGTTTQTITYPSDLNSYIER